MRQYQSQFLGRKDEFFDGPEFQSTDDRAALLEAHRLLAPREYFYSSFEVWEESASSRSGLGDRRPFCTDPALTDGGRASPAL